MQADHDQDRQEEGDGHCQGPQEDRDAQGQADRRGNTTMPTEFIAQNGAEFKQTTKISVTGCKATKAVKKKVVKKKGQGKGEKK
jgi:hypothetical protein